MSVSNIIKRDRCAFHFRNSDYDILKATSDKQEYGIYITHKHSPLDMDGISKEMLRIAAEFNGHYDGWETQILDTLFN